MLTSQLMPLRQCMFEMRQQKMAETQDTVPSFISQELPNMKATDKVRQPPISQMTQLNISQCKR